MKKLTTTLIAAFASIIFAAAAFAGQVTLNNNSGYEVTIDGAAYGANRQYAINDLQDGSHMVAVYKVTSSGLFSKNKTLISSKQFTLGNNTVVLTVNQSGQIQINKNGSNTGSGTNNGGRSHKKHNQHVDDNDNHDNHGGKYGNSEGKGKGHKYGHYKNKKQSGKQHNDD